ncbi:hypothetical protein H8959_003675 [Pygathrix nigripes]
MANEMTVKRGGLTSLPGDWLNPEVIPEERVVAEDPGGRPRFGTMSWIPFKIGQPKKQIVPKTVERDFEREYGKLQQLEEQTRKLQKDMKKSTDADLAMSKSAVKISLDLLSNPLCEQDQDLLSMVTALDTAMKRMDAFNQEKVNQIQKTVIEPLKKFGSVFPSLNMAVKRREQALQDYRRLQAKVEKYEEKEKTGPVLAKLHQVPGETGRQGLDRWAIVVTCGKSLPSPGGTRTKTPAVPTPPMPYPTPSSETAF